MKFDSVYIFHFQKEDKDEAIVRLKKSLSTINFTEFNIGIINCSEYCIKDCLDDRIKYFHDFKEGLYNRSYMINKAVEQFVTAEYFNISDVDIMYPPTYAEAMNQIIQESGEPCRIVYFNNNMCNQNFDTYEDCHNNYPNCQDHLRSKRGRAGGLGMVHTESFHKICGFEERYFGYSPEDQDFNLRISKINKYIEVDDEKVNTYHLWHMNNTPLKQYRQNMRMFFYIRDYIEQYNLKVVKAGEIEIPEMIYHQEGENIIEVEF